MTGQLEKIKAKIEPTEGTESPEIEKPRVKKERTVDPEAEARRAARRAARAERRKTIE